MFSEILIFPMEKRGYVFTPFSHNKFCRVPIENRIYIRGEFRESLGMNFFQSLLACKGVQSVQIM